MRKSILSIFVLIVFGLAAYSQSAIIKDEDGNIVSGQTYNLSGTDTILCHLSVTNSSASSVDYKLKKVQINIVPGSENVFCWDNCYPPSTMVSQGTVSIGAGQTNSTAFVGDYYSKGTEGSSTIRYIFVNNADKNDTSWVNVVYTSTVGIERNIPVFTLSNPYPNPSNENVSFKFAINKPYSQAAIRIFDLLGNVVLEKNIIETEGVTTLVTTNLMNGIYFYSIVIDEKPYVSRKMVVKH